MGGQGGDGGGGRYLGENLPDKLLVSLIVTKPQHQNLQQPQHNHMLW